MKTTRHLRGLGLPAIALGLALSTAACGSSTRDAGNASADYDSMSAAALAKAANQEGTVTWYTTFTSTDVDPMIQAFNQDYPHIKVDALRLSADQIPPKIITEQKGHQYTADVVSGDSPQVAQLIQAKTLQPYTPRDEAAPPKGLSLPKGYEGIVYANTTVLAYNPTLVKQKGLPIPTSVETFTEPAWKGHFSIDPTALNWYDSLIKAMGHDKALDLVQRLGDNDPVFVESHAEAVTDVQSGEPAGAATVYGFQSPKAEKAAPGRYVFVNPKPLPTSLNLIDIVANAPHPAAARLFEDWIVSRSGQQAIVTRTNHTTLRDDVTNDPTVWDEKKWPAAWGNPMLSPDSYNSELAEFTKALHAPQ